MTAGAVLLLLAGERLHLPLVDEEIYRIFDGTQALARLSPLAFGFWPFIAGYLLVESIAQVHPRFRPLRHGSPRERALLTRASWGVAIVLATWQGLAYARYVGSLRGLRGDPALPPGSFAFAAVAASLVAGTALVGYGAVLVSRHGVGNGFTVLLAVHSGQRIFWVGREMALTPRDEWSDAALLAGLAAVLLVPLLVAHRPREATYPHVPVPTCGLAALEAPWIVFAFPARLAAWFPSVEPLAEALRRWRFDSWSAALLDVAIVSGLAIVLARLFFPRDGVLDAYRRVARDSPDDDADTAVRRALRAANRRSVGLVIGIALVPTSMALLGFPVGVSFAALVDVAVVVAVALDLRGEAKARATAPDLVATRPLHRVYAVDPTMHALATAGIAAFPRALHYRTLFHFFAPWAPVEILVPAERADEASAICARMEAQSVDAAPQGA